MKERGEAAGHRLRHR